MRREGMGTGKSPLGEEYSCRGFEILGWEQHESIRKHRRRVFRFNYFLRRFSSNSADLARLLATPDTNGILLTMSGGSVTSVTLFCPPKRWKSPCPGEWGVSDDTDPPQKPEALRPGVEMLNSESLLLSLFVARTDVRRGDPHLRLNLMHA